MTDLRFFSDEINLIASCGKDRSLFVYRVIETPDIDEISISPIVTFHLKPPGDPEQEDCMTLAWHTILQVGTFAPFQHGSSTMRPALLSQMPSASAGHAGLHFRPFGVRLQPGRLHGPGAHLDSR